MKRSCVAAALGAAVVAAADHLAAAIDTADAGAPTHSRRFLASDAHGGLSIKRDKAQVAMGTQDDVVLRRTGDGELTINANTLVDGALNVAGDVAIGGSVAVGSDECVRCSRSCGAIVACGIADS
jgi:hypothetical protein